MRKDKVAIVTYYGLDGACAAAVALLKYPEATLITTSAYRIGETFQALTDGGFSKIHVCGVGVNCEWSLLEQASRAMKKDGTEIVWHCGRDYLDSHEKSFRTFCTPLFRAAGTNAGALAQNLGLSERCDAHLLVELAWHDRHVAGGKMEKDQTRDQSDWIDFINAAISSYFKYQDQEAYVDAVRKLARQELTMHDRVAIDTFRRTGYRYVLHGKSPAIQELKRRIQKCAGANRHVVITGESGVGKEHVAHLLWEASPQASGPFIPVNCAMYAGNSNLANSDLFGHTKGAFTGSVSSRKGKFIEADTGILFLDELGELPLEVQAKLLRVIEDGLITPEGADVPEKRVSVRIVAATNRELPRLIQAGQFRMDLYHRIATLRIHVPPLRERLEDIEAIVPERLALLEKEGYRPKITKADYKALRAYDWPGNVRQLTKVLERAVLLGTSLAEAVAEEKASGGAMLYRNDGDRPPDLLFPVDQNHVCSMKEIQQIYARNVWELLGRNYAATARALDVNPNTLRYSYLSNDEQ